MNRFHLRCLAAAAALLAVFLPCARAHAQNATTMTIAVGTPPVVRVQMRSGTLTIRTWDKPQVQIASSDPVQVRHFDPDTVAHALRGGDIPIFAARVLTPDGPVMLPPEDFPVPALLEGPHDGVQVFGPDTGADVTLTVPNSTALIWAMIGRGRIDLRDYRNGAFVTRVHTGAVTLSNVGGDAYVEVARGPVRIANSAFNRIRARTALGNILFENCNARQIEVTSFGGSIAYDNGTFVAGMARFESVNGDVALGIAGGGVEIAAHSDAGRVYSDLDGGGRVQSSQNDAQAIVGGGGPVVTAASRGGNVYLYSGAFKAKPQLQRKWRPLTRIIRARTSARRPYRV